MQSNFDVVERIKQICNQKGISFYRLSQDSGIPYSTLTNSLNQGTVPSIYTLERICSALDITLSQFFKSEDTQVYTLTKEQITYLHLFDSLSSERKKRVIAYMQGLNDIPLSEQ